MNYQIFDNKKFTLTRTNFSFEFDANFDLLKNNLKYFIDFALERIDNSNFSDQIKKNSKEKVKSVSFKLYLCPDCDRQFFSNYNRFECNECQQWMVDYEVKRSNFTCSKCHKSWEGFCYHDSCPSCRT